MQATRGNGFALHRELVACYTSVTFPHVAVRVMDISRYRSISELIEIASKIVLHVHRASLILNGSELVNMYNNESFLCKYVSFRTAADPGSNSFDKQLKPGTISNCQSVSGIKAALSDDD